MQRCGATTVATVTKCRTVRLRCESTSREESEVPNQVDTQTLDEDEQFLAGLGYKTELRRTFGSFTTFAVGYAFISVLTGMFTLYGFAWAAGGPASFWAFVIAAGGQFLFALIFAEVAVRYPLQGSLYNWTKHIAPNKGVSWMAGISMILAFFVSAAAVALTMQALLPFISSVFWIYGSSSSAHDAAVNGVILGGIMLVLTTTIILLGARVRGLVNNLGVIVELIGVAALVIIFLFHAHHGPQVVLHSNGTGHQYSLGYFGAILVAALLGLFIMWGFDTAGSIGEETLNPRKNCPSGIKRALIAAAVGGGLLLITAAMSIKNTHDPRVASEGLSYVILTAFGSTGGKIMIACAAIAVFVCGLANQVGAVNMIYAMSRDNGLPGARVLGRVSTRKVPVHATLLVGAVVLAITFVQIWQPALFVAFATTSVLFCMFAYLLLMYSSARLRRQGGWSQPDKRYFSLGRWGLPVSIAATLWAVFVVVDSAWPRAVVYNPAAPFHWYFRWLGVIMPVVLLGASFCVYWLRQRNRLGILPEHAAARRPAEPTGPSRLDTPAVALDAPDRI
jgi:urea carboxylase system permease